MTLDVTTPHHHLHIFQHSCEGPNSVHNTTLVEKSPKKFFYRLFFKSQPSQLPMNRVFSQQIKYKSARIESLEKKPQTLIAQPISTLHPT
jgi:hypothetical protein